MQLQILPKRPYKNYTAYAQEWIRLNGLGRKWDSTIGYPCRHCHGSGKVTRFEDRDVIEGYKLAPRYVCGNCINGAVPESHVQKGYKNAINFWEEAYARAKKIRDEQLTALSLIRNVLNKTQMQLLQLPLTKGK